MAGYAAEVNLTPFVKGTDEIIKVSAMKLLTSN